MKKILISALLTSISAGAFALTVDVTGARDWGNNNSGNVNYFDQIWLVGNNDPVAGTCYSNMSQSRGAQSCAFSLPQNFNSPLKGINIDVTTKLTSTSSVKLTSNNYTLSDGTYYYQLGAGTNLIYLQAFKGGKAIATTPCNLSKVFVGNGTMPTLNIHIGYDTSKSPAVYGCYVTP